MTFFLTVKVQVRRTNKLNAEFECPVLGFGLVTTASTQMTTYQDQGSGDSDTVHSSLLTLWAEVARGSQQREGAWAGERGWGGREACSHLRLL